MKKKSRIEIERETVFLRKKPDGSATSFTATSRRL